LTQKKIEPLFKDAKHKFTPYLEKIQKRINYYDYDCFIVVVGKERRGKSTLAIQIAHFLTKGKLKTENICMDMTEFTSQLQSTKKGDVIIFDEAGTNLYSREAMTTINRTLTKAFMVSGLKNIAIILCLPSFFSLDTYIRTHRVDLLVYVPSRGRFKAYSTKRAKLISLKGAKMKNINVTKANDVGWFPKKFPDEQIEQEYRIKERKYKFAFIKDLKNMLEGYYTTAQFCKATGYDLRTIYSWIKDKKIKAKKVGKKWFILKSEADRIVQENNS